MLLKGYNINDKRFCGFFVGIVDIVEIVENYRDTFDLGLYSGHFREMCH